MSLINDALQKAGRKAPEQDHLLSSSRFWTSREAAASRPTQWRPYVVGSAVTTAAFVVVSVIGPGLPGWEQAIGIAGVEALPPAETGRPETVLPVSPSPTAVVPVDSMPAASEARVPEVSSNQAAKAISLPPATVVAVNSSSVDSVMSRLEPGRIYIREMTAPDGSLLTLEGIISSDVRSIAVINETMIAIGDRVADFVVADVTRADVELDFNGVRVHLALK